MSGRRTGSIQANVGGVAFLLRENYDRHNGHFIELVPLERDREHAARLVAARFKGELERRELR